MRVCVHAYMRLRVCVLLCSQFALGYVLFKSYVFSTLSLAHHSFRFFSCAYSSNAPYISSASWVLRFVFIHIYIYTWLWFCFTYLCTKVELHFGSLNGVRQSIGHLYKEGKLVVANAGVGDDIQLFIGTCSSEESNHFVPSTLESPCSCSCSCYCYLLLVFALLLLLSLFFILFQSFSRLLLYCCRCYCCCCCCQFDFGRCPKNKTNKQTNKHTNSYKKSKERIKRNSNRFSLQGLRQWCRQLFVKGLGKVKKVRNGKQVRPPRQHRHTPSQARFYLEFGGVPRQYQLHGGAVSHEGDDPSLRRCLGPSHIAPIYNC